MNHIFGGHDQFDLAVYRNVQFVDLALTGGMLELPHPLFTDDVDFLGIFWRPVLDKVNFRAPEKNRHGNQQGNHRPESLQFHRAFDRAWDFRGIAPAIFDDKENYDERNQQREKDRHAGDVEIQRVHIARIGRSTFRNEWKPGLHKH